MANKAKLAAATPKLCKVDTKDGEWKGCINTAECVKGAWVPTEAEQKLTFLTKADAK